MSLHVTKYRTENGKTRRVKNGAAGKPDADSKNTPPGNPAKGAQA
jgi:hypothetical protein